MISKGLLSEVLGRKVSEIQPAVNINDLAIGFEGWKAYSSFDMCINIYELAYKCKEWAYDNGYILSSSKDMDSIWYCEINKESLCIGLNYSTEPESIIQACQWILDNKDK